MAGLKIVKKFSAVLTVFFLSLLVAVGLMRLYLFGFKKGRPIFRPDIFLGHLHTPNNHFSYSFAGGRADNSTNSFGLIGKEVTKAKPEGVYRIVILGDSYTEALQ